MEESNGQQANQSDDQKANEAVDHKAGFVNIIGSPNVGKSTLMNELVGERMSIITRKAQTTRHRILGIVNDENYQIVYSDTPGVLLPSYKMHEGMMKFVQDALKDADVLLVVTELGEKSLNNPETQEKLKKMDTPILLLINKVDKGTQEQIEEFVDYWSKELPKAEILPISALEKMNLTLIMDWIVKKLPVSPPFYAKDALTDKPERFFVSEIIREKILLNYSKEVPYSVEIEVESFKESEKIIRIRAIIYVARDSQKAIIIGKQGKSLKTVGIEARKDLEEFFGKQVYLEMFVKVKKNWRDDDKDLKNFGYL